MGFVIIQNVENIELQESLDQYLIRGNNMRYSLAQYEIFMILLDNFLTIVGEVTL